MDFVAIDFETAEGSPASPCSIGFAIVEDGAVVENYQRLIKPHESMRFDPFNITIHGIGPEDVAGEPDWDSLWPELRPLIEGRLLVAHHAPFDVGVLTATLGLYGLAVPDFRYVCSVVLARRAWPGLLAYNLGALAERFEIPLRHHDAADDARACAHIALLAMAGLGVADEPGFQWAGIAMGSFDMRGHFPLRSFSPGRDPVYPTVEEFDEEHPFFGKSVCFTGRLSSMTQRQAAQRLVDSGGIHSTAVNERLDYLVQAGLAAGIPGIKGASGKTQRALHLIAGGCPIELLSEEEFVEMLG